MPSINCLWCRFNPMCICFSCMGNYPMKQLNRGVGVRNNILSVLTEERSGLKDSFGFSQQQESGSKQFVHPPSLILMHHPKGTSSSLPRWNDWNVYHASLIQQARVWSSYRKCKQQMKEPLRDILFDSPSALVTLIHFFHLMLSDC